MKKIAILILLLLISPIILAVELDMKTEFKQGETFMARVSGNFLDLILEENIFFYKEHVGIPMIANVQEIDDEFYIYAQLLDKTENNYSMVIKNIRYMQGSKISEEEIRGNFSISSEQADFSISPGFVVTDNDFFIEVQNLQDYKISIQSKTSSEKASGFFDSLFGSQEENSVDLKSGEIKKINFEVENITQSGLKIIELSTENLKYEIPVYVLVAEEPEEKQKSFRFESSELNISMATGINNTRIIYLHNTGQETLENISLSLSDSLNKYLSLSVNEIEKLEKNSSTKIELYLSSDEERKIEGQITARENNGSRAYSAVFLNFVKDYVPPEKKIITSKTCSELGGEICDENEEECDGEKVNAKYGVCCLGNCKEIKKSSKGKIIGWIMIIGIIGFLVWFFKQRYRKT